MVLKNQREVMPRIRVRLFANFREFTKTKELEIDGSTVREILEILCKKFPGIEEMLFNGENLQPYVNVFLDGRNVLESCGLDAAISPGDEVAIFPPVSGG